MTQKPATPNLDNLGKLVTDLVFRCVENAVEFCEDMLYDSGEIEDTSLNDFRISCVHSAEHFMETELDPNGEAVLPDTLKAAISEAVKTYVDVGFKVKKPLGVL